MGIPTVHDWTADTFLDATFLDTDNGAFADELNAENSKGLDGTNLHASAGFLNAHKLQARSVMDLSDVLEAEVNVAATGTPVTGLTSGDPLNRVTLCRVWRLPYPVEIVGMMGETWSNPRVGLALYVGVDPKRFKEETAYRESSARPLIKCGASDVDAKAFIPAPPNSVVDAHKEIAVGIYLDGAITAPQFGRFTVRVKAPHVAVSNFSAPAEAMPSIAPRLRPLQTLAVADLNNLYGDSGLRGAIQNLTARNFKTEAGIANYQKSNPYGQWEPALSVANFNPDGNSYSGLVLGRWPVLEPHVYVNEFTAFARALDGGLLQLDMKLFRSRRATGGADQQLGSTLDLRNNPAGTWLTTAVNKWLHESDQLIITVDNNGGGCDGLYCVIRAVVPHVR